MLKTPQAKAVRKIRLLLKKEFPDIQFTYTSRAPLKSYQEYFPTISVVWTNFVLEFEAVIKVVRENFRVLEEFEECDSTISIVFHRQENHYDGIFRKAYLYIKGEDL